MEEEVQYNYSNPKEFLQYYYGYTNYWCNFVICFLTVVDFWKEDPDDKFDDSVSEIEFYKLLHSRINRYIKKTGNVSFFADKFSEEEFSNRVALFVNCLIEDSYHLAFYIEKLLKINQFVSILNEYSEKINRTALDVVNIISIIDQIGRSVGTTIANYNNTLKNEELSKDITKICLN